MPFTISCQHSFWAEQYLQPLHYTVRFYHCTLSLSVVFILDLLSSSTESYSKQARYFKHLHLTREKPYCSAQQWKQKPFYIQPEGSIRPAHQNTLMIYDLSLLQATSKSAFRPPILAKLLSCGQLYVQRHVVLKICSPLQNHQFHRLSSRFKNLTKGANLTGLRNAQDLR